MKLSYQTSKILFITYSIHMNLSAMRKILMIFIVCSFAQYLIGQETLHPAIVQKAVYFDVSPPLAQIMSRDSARADRTWKEGVVKNIFRKAPEEKAGFVDPVVQQRMGRLVPQKAVNVGWDGVGNISGVTPPDTDGDVGPNHYFQMVNLSFAIYSKDGQLLAGPTANSSLWNNFPGPWAGTNDGDPIIMYDEWADRWVATQFALPNYPAGPFFELLAISTTNDPTGTWYRYAFQYTDMPDYPKLGIWHNAYTMCINKFTPNNTNYDGVGVVAFERAKMMLGDPNAQMVMFNFTSSQEPFGMLPADADGPAPPTSEPAYFSYFKSPSKMVIYKMNINWTSTSLSTLELDQNITVSSFSTSITGIPQKGTSKRLDAITDRLMYRLQYRNFGSYQTMVTNHNVAVSGRAAPRWYEFRKTASTNWTLYQEGTYAPSDNLNRWMGSIAMDSYGNIALGYSVSSSDIYPSVRYTGRLKNDPLGQMTIAETEIVAGTGALTSGFFGNARWGDYSSMTIDPVNSNQFWYTTEYVKTTSGSNWSTRVANFSFDNVSGLTLQPDLDVLCLGDSTRIIATPAGLTGNIAFNWTSNPLGFVSTEDTIYVKPSDSTWYICTSTDGSLTVTDSVLISVNKAPVSLAGADQEVCAGMTAQLDGSSVYGSTHYWTTSGDGTFNDFRLYNPIYTPGTNDTTTGSVWLIQHVNSVAPCTGAASDSLKLTIHGELALEAGKDSLICVNWIPYILQGSVKDGNNVLWTTAGDGTFDDVTNPNAAYTPGVNDLTNGSVWLYLAADAFAPCATGSLIDSLKLSISPCTGIEEIGKNTSLSISVSPNPNHGKFSIIINNLANKSSELSIVSSDGKVIEHISIPSITNRSWQHDFDLSNLPSGVYLAVIEQDGARKQVKITIN